MRARPPLLIWRFLFSDLLRTGGLAAAALVVVIAFAFSVRFLAEGKVDLAGALRLTTLALVPMLQYALPFAAGFGATLAYHRFAADNEATGAAAGGIGHRALIAPAALCGLALAAALAFMSHQVIPHFLRTIEETVSRDLAGVFVRAVDRGETVRLGDVLLHAREVAQAGPDPESGAAERLRLRGVLAATLDGEGRVTGSISADELSVWLFEEEEDGERFTEAQLLFRGASGEGAADIVRSGMFASQRLRIPGAFSDKTKYLTYAQLRRLRERPELLNTLDSRRRTLARLLFEQRSLDAAHRALFRAEPVRFERPGGESVLVRAAALLQEGDRWRFVPARNAPVRIEHTLTTGTTLRLSSAAAWLERENAPEAAPAASPGFRLRMEGVRPEDDPLAPGPGQASRVIGALRIAGLPAAGAPGSAAPVSELLDAARERAGDPAADLRGEIERAAASLEGKVESVQREVTAKLHERAAYALAALVVTLCGCVAGLRRADGLPLTVYLWSFFPALAAVLTVSAGENLTQRVGAPGLVLLWGGVAALAAYTLRELRLLLRH